MPWQLGAPGKSRLKATPPFCHSNTVGTSQGKPWPKVAQVYHASGRATVLDWSIGSLEILEGFKTVLGNQLLLVRG